MKQVAADVVVISAGTAGLPAAVTAAENGASVIVFEKAATVGGAGNMARGPFAVESFLQKHRKIALTREQIFKLHMDYTHWRVDARLVSAYINKSASTIDWLQSLGVEFIDVQCHNYGYNFTWHIIKGPLEPPEIPATGHIMMKLLFDKAQELGVKFYFRTPARKILKEGGRVTGVVAEEEESGEEIQAAAGAVIVATGGCGDNPEMIKKYTGFAGVRGRVAGVTGDGLRMAWEAGAAPTDIIVHGGIGGAAGIGQLLHVAPTVGQPNLTVNLFAERFMNEEIRQTTPFGGNAVATQKDMTAFVIFDEDTKSYYGEEGLDFPPGILYADPVIKVDRFDAEFQQAIDDGVESVFKANSIDEIAAWSGLDRDKLAETVAEYNRACDTGRDEVFHKDPKYLRAVRKPPFYACKLSGAFAFGTLGGIKINHRAEVVAKDFSVIPGLYAAGADANSIYGDTYIFYLPGNTLGFAINSGRMAGENAAAYVKSLG